MVGVPTHKAKRISCSDQKLSDAQTRNFKAISHATICPQSRTFASKVYELAAASSPTVDLCKPSEKICV